MKLFSKDYTKEEIALFEFLRTIPIFSSFTNHELFLCSESIYLRKYKQNEVIFFQDDPAEALYIVKKGFVSIGFKAEGKSEVLKVFKNGESFGHEALLDAKKRFTTAINEGETGEIYVIPKVHLEAVSNKSVKLKAKLYKNLAEFYGGYISELYKAYQKSFGLFELSEVHI